jgi:hypothetical protein
MSLNSFTSNPVESVEKVPVFNERDWLIIAPTCAISDIVKEVCRQFDIRKNDLESDRKTNNIVLPRQIAMSLAKHLTLKSLPVIGRAIGGREHTTVLYACRKWQPVMDQVAARVIAGSSISEWVKVYREQIKITAPNPNVKYRKRCAEKLGIKA